MTLNPASHKQILFQILKDVYSDTAVAPALGFKGGTAAFLFYGLTRFSVDLDFDLLDSTRDQEVFERLETIARKFGIIRDAKQKRYGSIIVFSYEERAQNIKIEVNRRAFGAQYELKTALGISMLVMTRPDMFANKLLAMFERLGRANRDIYDVWFFCQQRWPINTLIVEQRSGMPFQEFVQKCIVALERFSDAHILNGIGELLSQSQKEWARKNLRSETLFLLRTLLESTR